MKKIALIILYSATAVFMTQVNAQVVVVPLGGDTYQAAVMKTGQALCFDVSAPGGSVPTVACSGTNQDADLQKGLTPPMPRFTDNGNGTVKDNLTGLIWLKQADCPKTVSTGIVPSGLTTMADAYSFVEDLNSGTILSFCGDTAHNTDWRIPNRLELESLLALGNHDPALSSGHPFVDVESDYYWTSSYDSFFNQGGAGGSLGVGWSVHFSAGAVQSRSWTVDTSHTWPVRGGN